MRFALAFTHIGAVFVTSASSHGLFYSGRSDVDRCPMPCSQVGLDPLRWKSYPDASYLRGCDKPMLLSLAIYNPVNDPNTDKAVRACAQARDSDGPTTAPRLLKRLAPLMYTNSSRGGGDMHFANTTSEVACTSADARARHAQVTAQIRWSGTGDQGSASQIAAAAEQLITFVQQDRSCVETAMFAQSGHAVVGVYVGSQLAKKTSAALLNTLFVSRAKAATIPRQMLAQLCGQDRPMSSQILGVFADASGNLSAVQQAVRSWDSSELDFASHLNQVMTVPDVSVDVLPGILYPGSGNSSAEIKLNSTMEGPISLDKRGDCRTTRVTPGSGCWQVAKDCDISQDDLVRYNGGDPKFCDSLQRGQYVCCSSGSLPKPPSNSIPPNADGTCKYVQAGGGDGCWALANKCGKDVTVNDITKANGGQDSFCNSIQKGQYVCCGQGKLPDFSPKPNKDGSCFSVTLRETDLCGPLAETYHISDYHLIEQYNKKTWGWAGCNGLQPGMAICLSKGDPPMPNPLDGVQCGPRVPGTKKPTNGTDLASLNPCPLNVCCNVHGHCGLDRNFCVPAPLPGGGPGSAVSGSNGCIASCGMNITNNNEKVPIAEFKKVGYFEAWNLKERRCLNMDISKMTSPGVNPPGSTHYSHVHFAFPNIRPDFSIDVSQFPDQFEGLKKLQNIKRVVSFGGWAFSNDNTTYMRFRDIVATEGNRQRMAKNVADFVTQNGLDGVDFDWEYPGATDIPDTPPGSPDEGENYLKFLKAVRAVMPKEKSLSIAAPASFWYLQNFPIKGMSEVLDYIIFMTYDLHGQWDVKNAWTSPGCTEGNCLRSHVNMTETMLALAMITKAGVPAKKVVVGMARYGRSFHMSDPSCTGPMCTFTGTKMHSDAKKGPCTGTAGYISNYEIGNIVGSVGNEDFSDDRKVRQWEDEGDILVYDDTEWVSWLTPTHYLQRAARWYDLHFGGTSDWAVDLEYSFGKQGRENRSLADVLETGDRVCDDSRYFASLEELEKATDLSAFCREIAALVVLHQMLNDAQKKYNDENNDYDAKFNSYVRYMNNMVNPAIDAFMLTRGGLPSEGMKYFQCVIHREGNPDETKMCSDLSDSDINDGSYNMDFVLKDRKGFFAGLMDKYRIPESWVEFADRGGGVGYCPNDGDHFLFCPPTTGNRHWHSYPSKKANIDVPNPKEIIKGTVDNIDDLRSSMLLMRLRFILGIWAGNNEDVVQVLSVPVFLLQQAVESMEQVRLLAGKQEEEDREAQKNLIITIVGAVLFVVPFVGQEAALAAGAANMARAIFILGETANTAYTIYTIVDDPSSAILGLMGMLFGVAGMAKSLRDVKGFEGMAGKRAAIRSDAAFSKMTGSFKANDDKLQNILKVCRR